jgi:hypothetical protein
MMRRLLPCLCLVLVCGSAAVAQTPEYPKADFTAAYTLNRFEIPAGGTRTNLIGFTLAPAYNFRSYFALEGDVTFTTKTLSGTRRSLATYLIGPRFTKRTTDQKLEPFVHALVGGGHLSGFGSSTNGWAGKFGGGLDIVAGKHIAIRVFQVDYYRYHGHVAVGTQRLNNAAFTFGIRIF